MAQWTAAPSIIAESLVGVPDPLLTALQAGPPSCAAAVAAQLARSLSPAEHPVQPPSWLLPSQYTSFRRVLAGIHRYRGALLADPVGSGKTFVALAVAQQLSQGPTVCLVPAGLMAQWELVAAQLAIPVIVCSHERVSRGHLPGRSRGLVIIDESHHFRNPHTRRYRHLALWLVGRSALLVTATPIVNRASDLAHQLLLAVRDDALILEGVSSIRSLLRRNCSSPALGQLVFENEVAMGSRPRRVRSPTEPAQQECSLAQRATAMVDRLRLSRSQPLSELLRGVLLRSAASSPAAFRERLTRYRRLLLHARDSVRAGRAVNRMELKRFTRELDDQLVWWELLPVAEGNPEIEAEDLDILEDIIAQIDEAEPKPDPKLDRLRGLLVDGVPSLVFTAHRATVRYIRDHLADLKIAWCTGDRAGIGITPLPRRSVLGWFRAAEFSSHAPAHLVVTDVAAEGLDLQRVARVIHYDLPWTPMRIEQREGRAVRYGSRHARVMVVPFVLPAVLEQRLRVSAVLERKGRLPGAIGLGPSGRQIWKWRAKLGDRFDGISAAAGVAWVANPVAEPGLLAGFALHSAGEARPLAVTVLWMDQNGKWTESPQTVESHLELAAAERSLEPVDPPRLKEQLALLAGVVRERLAATKSRRWLLPEAEPEVGRAVSLLQTVVGRAARRHDHRALAELERAIGFVTSGHTAGESALVRRLAQADEAQIRNLLKDLPSGSPQVEQIEVKLTGLISFGPAKNSSVSVPSPGCPD